MRGQKRSTAQLSSVPSVGYVTSTHQKYSSLNLRTPVSFLGQIHIKYSYTCLQSIRSDRHHYQEDRASRPESCALSASPEVASKAATPLTSSSPSGVNRETCAAARSQHQSEQASIQTQDLERLPNPKAVTQSQPVSSFSSQTAGEGKHWGVMLKPHGNSLNMSFPSDCFLLSFTKKTLLVMYRFINLGSIHRLGE